MNTKQFLKQKFKILMLTWFSGSVIITSLNAGTPDVTFRSLLQEMADRTTITHWPDHAYKSLQASSYNRTSVAPDKPGWFADSDGVSWIREELNGGKKEYVIMEHNGPGCITRMWTPYFYYNFNNRTGPNVKIYLDGNKNPIINENFIALLTGNGSIHPPFAVYTARAGICFLPIPFSKSCKITLDDKAFYNIINYRAYSTGTSVQTFTSDLYIKASSLLAATAELLRNPQINPGDWKRSLKKTIMPGDSLVVSMPEGNQAIRQLSITIDPVRELQSLRSTILKMNFDGRQTVWCPVGDFFCSSDTINQFSTRDLIVSPEGKMTCNWIMPYFSEAQLCLLNLFDKEVTISLSLSVRNRVWDDRSMYFHTNWADIGPLPGNKFFDLNFIDIEGKGVIAGDALTVLSPGRGLVG